MRRSREGWRQIRPKAACVFADPQTRFALSNSAMNPALIDPHNHAPAVAAGDAWADVEGCLSGPIVIEDVDEWEDEQDEMEVDLPDTLPLAVIPPKRQKESAASATVSAKEEGLRIEPRIERLASNGVEDGIHSQEIESQVFRLDPRWHTLLSGRATFHSCRNLRNPAGGAAGPVRVMNGDFQLEHRCAGSLGAFSPPPGRWSCHC